MAIFTIKSGQEMENEKNFTRSFIGGHYEQKLSAIVPKLKIIKRALGDLDQGKNVSFKMIELALKQLKEIDEITEKEQ